MPVILKNLYHSLKKIIEEFPNDQKNLSFLIATGLPQSGMTTLLKQYQMQHVHIDDEYQIHIFYNNQGLILEINESFLSHCPISLAQFFKKLNKIHRQLRISGFLFFVDISNLLIADHHELNIEVDKQAHLVKRFIDALDYSVRSGLVITKLDQITGFTDFFSMSHDLELNEPLGFSLSVTPKKANFNQLFSESWSNFVANLNQSMLQKIHTTRANKKRILIREFPLQIAILESKFLHILKKMAHDKAHIHGIYFTCAEQKGKNLNYLNQKIQNAFSLMVPISSMQSVNFKPFFIKGAIKHCQDLSTYTPKPNFWNNKNHISILGFGLLSSIWLLYQTIQSHILIHNVHQSMHAIQSHETSNYFEHLQNLEKNLHNLQNLPLLFSFNKNIQATIQFINSSEKKLYQEALIQQMIDVLKLEMQNKDISRSYYALKTYKSLITQRKDQTQYILDWFNKYSFIQNPKAHNLQALLNKKFIWEVKWPYDQQVIDSTESFLHSLPKEYLIYQIVSKDLLKPASLYSIPGFEPNQIQIPKAYTKLGFIDSKKYLQKSIKKFQEESWVLNQSIDFDIEEKIIATYTQHYVQWWKNLYHAIHPKHFTTLVESKDIFHTLQKAKTIENVISLIASETSPNIKENDNLFNVKISSQFSDLQFANNQNRAIHNIWEELNKFITMFIVINDNGQASFHYLRSYFNQTQYNDSLYAIGEMSKHLPEPASSWLSQIHDDIWLSLIQTTKTYLNQVWHDTIYEPYNQDVKRFYPFSNSNEEISIQRFEEYFSPNGKIQHFFREYLQAFMNTNQAQWNIKQIEDKQFPLKKNLIDELIQANVITSMFFPNNSSTCKIDFSIEKMSLDPVISSLTFNIGQRALRDIQQDSLYEQNIIWPATGASLSIQTIDGQKYNLNEQGEWGLFRILQQINVIPDPSDASALQILLEINGNSGRYILKTTSLLNPFSPGILNDFQLEERITD